MRVRAWGPMVFLAALCCTGCAHYPGNPPLTEISAQAGYRYSVVREEAKPDNPFVLLAFSGGGTRAAAFSFGLLEELSQVRYTAADASRHRLIDHVEIVSSVSGGSFTSAYYALFPERFFEEFPERFLYRNIQAGLILRLFNPYNWYRLAFPNFSRIDLAAEYYNNTVFEGKTFADLLAKPKGSAPFLVLNATDIGIAHRFEFTQDQFDLLCSDLSGVAVSRAVAASSNFPAAFAPLTLDIHQKECGPLPAWISNALEPGHYPEKSRLADARAAASYRETDRKFAHLLDGGLSDNLGLRGPFQAVTTTDSAWSLVQLQNRKKLGRLLVIAANAKTSKKRSWDAVSTPPGVGSVLGVVMNGPMDDVSADSVEMTDGHFKQIKQLSRTINSCNDKLQACSCSTAIDNPFLNGASQAGYSFAELSFDDLPDQRLRSCLQELPTTFALPAHTVDLLRASAGYLLMHSGEFVSGMQQLDPGWKPREVVIDPKLVDEVCK
jgi:NTE family protein